MIQTIQGAKISAGHAVRNNPLSPAARKLVLIAMNVVYAKQGTDMFKQALQNTKSAAAIPQSVAMFALPILQHMSKQIDALPTKQAWGKGGVVHAILDSVFEVAKGLGYPSPPSSLEVAYKQVFTQFQHTLHAKKVQAASQAPPPPMQGAMPPQGLPPGAPSGGGPPNGPPVGPPPGGPPMRPNGPPPMMPMQGAMQ